MNAETDLSACDFRLKVGDGVIWESRGCYHRGVVVREVEAGMTLAHALSRLVIPLPIPLQGHFTCRAIGAELTSSRCHPSYLVLVSHGRRIPGLHWPHTRGLVRAGCPNGGDRFQEVLRLLRVRGSRNTR